MPSVFLASEALEAKPYFSNIVFAVPLILPVASKTTIWISSFEVSLVTCKDAYSEVEGVLSNWFLYVQALNTVLLASQISTRMPFAKVPGYFAAKNCVPVPAEWLSM